MRDRNESEFHLDRLTADWLPGRFSRLVRLVPPLVAGLFVGVVDGLAYAAAHGLEAGTVNGLAVGLFFWMFFALPSGEAELGLRWSWRRARASIPGSLALGLAVGLLSSRVDAIVYGLFFVLVFGLFADLRGARPVEQVRFSSRRIAGGLLGGTTAGVFVGLAYALAYGLAGAPAEALTYAWSFGALGGALMSVVLGMEPALVERRLTPNEGIVRSARHALLVGTLVTLAVGLAAAVVFGPVLERPEGTGEAVRVGLLLGAVTGLLLGGFACLHHIAVRGALTLFRYAPWDYANLLNDASDAGLLRRAGSGYLFVHRLVMEQLAQRPNRP